MGASAQTDEVPFDESVEIFNAGGKGRFVVVCEHASNFIPAELDNLGLQEADLQKHIAFDIGALEVARAMALLLDAPLVASRISRLVYDCNRERGDKTAVLEVSDGVDIPGNAGLDEAQRNARRTLYCQPLHDALSAMIARKVQAGGACTIVTVHSFTPVYQGIERTLDVGLLHDVDARLADEMLAIAQKTSYLSVEKNAPYAPSDGVTHTLVEHGVEGGHMNVMLEIRNDLIDDELLHPLVAEHLGGWIVKACENLEG